MSKYNMFGSTLIWLYWKIMYKAQYLQKVFVIQKRTLTIIFYMFMFFLKNNTYVPHKYETNKNMSYPARTLTVSKKVLIFNNLSFYIISILDYNSLTSCISVILLHPKKPSKNRLSQKDIRHLLYRYFVK